ncbi:MAG: hypothetical protein EPN57_13230 [Paraburkholderia sp.]|nr:MAG: hypothetical protein EPN57_13230 [Paraburkholderia sp.]
MELDIPTNGLHQFVADLAKRHRVVYVRDGYSVMAEVITRLSEDDVEPLDETRTLLIALTRAKIIDGPTMVTLLSRHLDETRVLGRFGGST